MPPHSYQFSVSIRAALCLPLTLICSVNVSRDAKSHFVSAINQNRQQKCEHRCPKKAAFIYPSLHGGMSDKFINVVDAQRSPSLFACPSIAVFFPWSSTPGCSPGLSVSARFLAGTFRPRDVSQTAVWSVSAAVDIRPTTTPHPQPHPTPAWFFLACHRLV